MKPKLTAQDRAVRLRWMMYVELPALTHNLRLAWRDVVAAWEQIVAPGATCAAAAPSPQPATPRDRG